MWQVSELTGKIYKNGISIPLDDSTEVFQEFLIAQQNGSVTYVESTPEEIAEANKPIVPETITKPRLKKELLKRGVLIEEIEQQINDVPSSIFSDLQKQFALIDFQDSTIFERYNADVILIATLMGIDEQLDEIFINGNL